MQNIKDHLTSLVQDPIHISVRIGLRIASIAIGIWLVKEVSVMGLTLIGFI